MNIRALADAAALHTVTRPGARLTVHTQQTYDTWTVQLETDTVSQAATVQAHSAAHTLAIIADAVRDSTRRLQRTHGR